jgi:hypothetical protein
MENLICRHCKVPLYQANTCFEHQGTGFIACNPQSPATTHAAPVLGAVIAHRLDVVTILQQHPEMSTANAAAAARLIRRFGLEHTATFVEAKELIILALDRIIRART